MTARKRGALTTASRLSLLMLSAALSAGAAAAASGPAPCFSRSQWRGWEPAGPRVIYLHVDARDVYRLDLGADAPMIESPGARLVSVVHGPDMICLPIDLQLQVSDGDGFSEPLFVRTLTRLTPDEAATLRKPRRPG